MRTGQLKVVDKRHVESIKSGRTNRMTIIGHRGRGLKVGDELHIIYKVSHGRINICEECLTKCDNPPDRVSQCKRYTNVFGNTTITKIEHVDLLHSTPEERDKWAQEDGFKGFENADDWYMTNYGEEWCFTPVTVVTWDKGPIAKRWKV